MCVITSNSTLYIVYITLGIIPHRLTPYIKKPYKRQNIVQSRFKVVQSHWKVVKKYTSTIKMYSNKQESNKTNQNHVNRK